MSTVPPPSPENSSQQFTSAKDAKAQAKAAKAYQKASRPWFKKKRFWLLGLLALLIVFIIATQGGDDPETASDTPTQSSPEQTSEDTASDDAAAEESTEAEAAPAEEAMTVSAQELIDALEGNALAASNEYKDKRVTVTGNVSNIDSSGNYFNITGTDDFSLTNIQINIDESHLDAVSAFTDGQEVTVTGTVTDVGEFLGYTIDAETVE